MSIVFFNMFACVNSHWVNLLLGSLEPCLDCKEPWCMEYNLTMHHGFLLITSFKKDVSDNDIASERIATTFYVFSNRDATY